MMLIAIAFVFLVYFLVSYVLALLAALTATAFGGQGRRWRIAVFVLMWGLVFWDWLPMEISYRHKCNTEAGFFVLKSLDEWKRENPGVWETLDPQAFPEEYLVEVKHRAKKAKRVHYQLPDRSKLVAYYDAAGEFMYSRIQRPGRPEAYRLNQRFIWDTVYSRFPFTISSYEDRLVDIKTGEVLAKYVDFGTTVPSLAFGGDSLSDLKFWMSKNSCESEARENRTKFYKLKRLAASGGKE